MVEAVSQVLSQGADENIAWKKSFPFILLHLSVFVIFFIDVRVFDVFLCALFYLVRMFFITAGYHRYFAHRSYKMGRISQFIMALGGTLAIQKGPLWWASHHRMHHKYSDTDQDVHSPKKGFWWSHVGWILCSKFDEPLYDKIRDFAKYPELRLLDRYYIIPPVISLALLAFFGGWSSFLVAGCLSTVLLYHGVFVINSLAHVFGKRRYATTDTSRNSMLLALITLGEGWHNNHHHFQASARQGFRWWEIDISFYILKTLAAIGLVWDLKAPPLKILDKRLIADGCFDIGMFSAYYEKAASSLSSVKMQELMEQTRQVIVYEQS